ncbi:hypothetical protein ANN_19047 [Periplaneta americana]|uniref:Uncharacterized protein n=1 Tax=Periplaneta americana TaxID=6978 RepID=A0ABQ8SRI4_PERAM|nr:hypothetical protein ANN_19047 [Periplaneta americana]
MKVHHRKSITRVHEERSTTVPLRAELVAGRRRRELVGVPLGEDLNPGYVIESPTTTRGVGKQSTGRFRRLVFLQWTWSLEISTRGERAVSVPAHHWSLCIAEYTKAPVRVYESGPATTYWNGLVYPFRVESVTTRHRYPEVELSTERHTPVSRVVYGLLATSVVQLLNASQSTHRFNFVNHTIKTVNMPKCAVSSTQKFLVQQHITTSKHQANKQLNSKQRQLFLTQPTTSNVRSEFNIDLCRSLISADIPL